MKKQVDKWFLGIVLTLIVVGFSIFLSAALGLLAREGAEFQSALASQLSGLFLGGLGLFLASRIKYTLWKKYAFWIFLAGVVITALVFVPGLGLEYGGAKRWLALGPLSFQPAEFLKLGFVLYFAAWLSGFRRRVKTVHFGLIPLTIVLGIVGLLLLKQPDTGTFLVILGVALGMFIASGAPWRHALLAGAGVSAGLGILSIFRPYVKERLLTFLNPALDPLDAGYQIQQSLIAVGSGEMWGRGFGQSVQKFSFLPEPISDSIFAVYAEEFGFVGAFFLIALFVFFVTRGFSLAKRAPDYFSRLTVIGIVILIAGQAFLNIGSMIGVFPLTGLPLPLVSHGGTALIFTLIAVGIVLNISRYCKTL